MKEVVVERILKLLIEEKAILRLLKIIENEEHCNRKHLFKHYNNGEIVTKSQGVMESTRLWTN